MRFLNQFFYFLLSSVDLFILSNFVGSVGLFAV